MGKMKAEERGLVVHLHINVRLNKDTRYWYADPSVDREIVLDVPIAFFNAETLAQVVNEHTDELRAEYAVKAEEYRKEQEENAKKTDSES